MSGEMKTFLVQLVRRWLGLALLALIWWYFIVPFAHWLMNNPHPLLEALRVHLVNHLTEYLGSLAVLAIAFVCTWPAKVPHSLRFIDQDLWTWFRDAFQTAVPAARNHRENPIPPAEPATTKE